MSTTISTTSSDGVEGVESLSRKCCDVLTLGEIPAWVHGVEIRATEADGATPAQQSCGGSGMAASFGQMWMPEGELTSAQPGDRLPPVGEIGTLVFRLRGVYGVGPGDPPEFGFRCFGTPPIQHAAADRIVSLEARIRTLEAELSDANHWRKRHSDDAAAAGEQSAEHWNKWKAAEACVAEAEHARAVAVAALSEQLDAANARVATLEAECVASRRLLLPDGRAFIGFYRGLAEPYNAARAATGPIGGVA